MNTTEESIEQQQRLRVIVGERDALREQLRALQSERRTVAELASEFRGRLDRLYVALQRQHGKIGDELAKTTRELILTQTTRAQLETDRLSLVARLWRLRACLRVERKLPASAAMPEDRWLGIEEVAQPIAAVDDDDDGPDPELVRELRESQERIAA